MRSGWLPAAISRAAGCSSGTSSPGASTGHPPARTRSAALSANSALPIPFGPASSQAWCSRPNPCRRGTRRRPRHGRTAGSQQILERGEQALPSPRPACRSRRSRDTRRLLGGEPAKASTTAAMIVRAAAADQVGAVGVAAARPARGLRFGQLQQQGAVGQEAVAADSRAARGPPRSRGRRRRPDRRSSCRGSGRTAPRRRAPAPAGWSGRHGRRGRRRTAGPRPPASNDDRGAAGRGSPRRRGCRRARGSRPPRGRARATPRPAPSAGSTCRRLPRPRA